MKITQLKQNVANWQGEESRKKCAEERILHRGITDAAYVRGMKTLRVGDSLKVSGHIVLPHTVEPKSCRSQSP